MRILHCVLILAFTILLKNINVYCDSSNPLPNSPLSYLSTLLKPKASPFKILATNTKLGKVHPQAPTPPPSSQVTSYILAVQWPPGVCTGNSGVTCKINPVPTEFTIHGLWPNPNGQSSTETLDPNQIATLTTQLNQYWPNLESAQQQVSINLKFWGHEWTDHGKYSEMGVREYFEKTLELFKGVGQGLKGKLAAEKITPTIYNTYKLQDIEAALKKINGGFSCTVICNQRNTSKKEKQIQEIRFRFTNDFQKQNNNVAYSTCGTGTTDVMFPLMQ